MNRSSPPPPPAHTSPCIFPTWFPPRTSEATKHPRPLFRHIPPPPPTDRTNRSRDDSARAITLGEGAPETVPSWNLLARVEGIVPPFEPPHPPHTLLQLSKPGAEAKATPPPPATFRAHAVLGDGSMAPLLLLLLLPPPRAHPPALRGHPHRPPHILSAPGTEPSAEPLLSPGRAPRLPFSAPGSRPPRGPAASPWHEVSRAW